MDGMVIPAPPEGARDGVGASRARRLDLAVTGMTGATCAARVERALGRGEGVLSASVSLATGRARVLLGSDQREDDASLAARLQSAVAEAGYGASLLGEGPCRPRRRRRRGGRSRAAASRPGLFPDRSAGGVDAAASAGAPAAP